MARHLDLAHLDTDDFYWEPTDPPFQVKRTIDTRLDLLRQAIAAADGRWGLSGSLDGWGDPLVELFDLVVFVETPVEVRLRRLRHRERLRYGEAALAPGGAMHATHTGFMAWAARYEQGDQPGRSLARHQAWLQVLPCPWVRLDGTKSVNVLVGEVEDALATIAIQA